MDKKVQNDRRKFLKKVAYTAPAIVALGSLTTPTKSNAAVLGGGGDTGDSTGDKETNSKLG